MCTGYPTQMGRKAYYLGVGLPILDGITNPPFLGLGFYPRWATWTQSLAQPPSVFTMWIVRCKLRLTVHMQWILGHESELIKKMNRCINLNILIKCIMKMTCYSFLLCLDKAFNMTTNTIWNWSSIEPV